MEDSKKEKIRLKELAILKAQNAMLEEAKNNLKKMDRGDDSDKVIEEILTAQKENLQMASSYYGADSRDIDKATYGEPNKFEIEKYNRRLQLKGITQEQLEEKDITKTVVSNNTDVKEDVKRPKRRKVKRVKGVGYVEDKDFQSQLKKEENTESVNYKKEVNTIESEDKIQNRTFYDIPDYVQYDIIPLPSNGECYPHKKSRIPVAYLTASDENLIASPNMYRDGKLIDAILDRKILDKSINPENLCKGDRDAIILWLRATGYGVDFPITVRNPQDSSKLYHTSIDLSKLKYIDFNLNGDEEGNFEYICENGDVIKFKFLTHKEEEIFKEKVNSDILDIDLYNINKHVSELQFYINKTEAIEHDDKNVFLDNLSDLKEYIKEEDTDIEYKEGYTKAVTERMLMHTVSVNNNKDREYIKNYIENMRSGEAYSYRNYILRNTPGVDFNINITIPESDGGGSFDTFLRIDDAIFLNV